MPKGVYTRNPEKVAIVAKARWAYKTPEERRASVMNGVIAAQSVEARQKNSTSVKASWARLTPEEKQARRDSMARARRLEWANKTKEERQIFSEHARKVHKEQIRSMSENERREHFVKVAAANRVTRNARTLEEKAAARERIGEIRRAMWAGRTPEERSALNTKNSTALKIAWASKTPKERATWISNIRKSYGPTSIEVITSELLASLGAEFISQHPIGPYTVDFYVVAKNLIIEADGTYWHSRPGDKERDALKDEYFQKSGYTLLRLPEADLCGGDDRFLFCYEQLRNSLT